MRAKSRCFLSVAGNERRMKLTVDPDGDSGSECRLEGIS